MTEMVLTVRCSGRPRDVDRVLSMISDYADEQFEAYTMQHGRPMQLVSWTAPADQQRKLYMALVEIMEWYDDLPNDIFDAMPLCIKRARKLIPERDK